MKELVTTYCLILFAVEVARNSRRIQRVISRSYMGPIDEKLNQLSWMMMLVGLLLTFSSSMLFLPCYLFIKIAAGLLIEYLNHNNEMRIQGREEYSAQQLIFPKTGIPYNQPKLLQ